MEVDPPAHDPEAHHDDMMTVDHVDGDDDAPKIWVESFPPEKNAGAKLGEARTGFEAIRDDQILRGAEILGPFESQEEWELAKWLIKNVGHGQADEFLKLPIIQRRVNPSFSNKDKLLSTIDSLPDGVEWNLHQVCLTGDLLDDDGNPLTENLELWWRDPVECIQRLYQDSAGSERVTDEMWTADWWWRLQQILPAGATIAPVILSSDKTRLSQFRGDKSAWPVYLTIGNIVKEVRREASSHATILIGYLPVGKFDCFSEKAKQAERYRTFHHCMSILTKSLVEAAKSGVTMACADGFIRSIWPIVAAITWSNGLRHFKNGISNVSQWTGAEHKAMEQVFLGIMAGAIPEGRVTQAVRAITDFIFLSSLQSHTTTTLAALSRALDDFHVCKDVFVELDARSPAHFNIRKFIPCNTTSRLSNSSVVPTDSTPESPERLHIDYAKNAYRASSKKDYTIQMTHWLRRQEAVDRFTLYLEWARGGGVQASDGDAERRAQLESAEKEADEETEFLEAVSDFLHNHGSPFTPQPFNGFDLFKRLTFILPIIPQASSKNLKNIVNGTTRLQERLSKDCASHTSVFSSNAGHLPRTHNTPLAYVEWYTPFGTPDATSGLFTVKPSTRRRHVYGEIIEVDRIVRNIHLIPKY
ncbi:putative zn-finger domain-containing protein [Lyophyllum shimeji]|uniref:Zn-finger domain-containing protein n=1 Tax=Lyophyllum shimeji TaxID=47721 RepID=A0A9P3PYK3_LYOSH|nr:putative zn-finger domain-containing protein [Lyophyllum shimeji]